MTSKELATTFITIQGEQFYKIEDVDTIRPFLMSIVSPNDHWMFIASNGGMTAGRRNAASSLFPYYTDDKLIDLADITGSKTIVRFNNNDKTVCWEPFSDRNMNDNVQRNLFKNRVGNKVVFEEIHHEFQLQFQYMWTFSEDFGFIKRTSIKNNSSKPISFEILDGVQNILPHGVDVGLQESRSTLVDAYKKNELDSESGLGLFSLSAMIVDKAIPSESLACTTAWSTGLDVDKHLLSSVQLKAFRRGKEVVHEEDVRAEKGAYFIVSDKTLQVDETAEWFIVCEVNQTHTQVINLKQAILTHDDLIGKLNASVDTSTEQLKKLVAKADGLQNTNDVLSSGRHYTNVLFNIMRGGVFDEQYLIHKKDYVTQIVGMNVGVYERNQPFLEGLDDALSLNTLLEKVDAVNDTDLLRITYEYLPLFFSRRHGDPSRPWNHFSIDTRDLEGNRIKNYEGNWRDIFQNWEALAYSFPNFTFGFISKFLNASTIDGYNPYRIFKDGFDWEVADEDDPWSYIGYWGDHQIIYLSKLLEICEKHQPSLLSDMLHNESFVYANVPYRIKEFKDICRNPRDTIEYHYEEAKRIEQRVSKIGSDGKLCLHRDDSPVSANLIEKLMVSLCTKLYNFIPDGGIWLNTQRPEWNDANNALVGNGVSMVTLYYLRRFIRFLQPLISKDEESTTLLNRPVGRMMTSIKETFENHLEELDNGFNDSKRFAFVNELGNIGEYYRRQAYAGFRAEKETIEKSDISTLLSLALQYIDATIATNKRADYLYHSYNVMEIKDGTISIDHLYEMLEGQVAILSAGVISPEESASILNALKASDIYRSDQYSYLLYPDRQLTPFLHKNDIPTKAATNIKLFELLHSGGDKSLVTKDVTGRFHFQSRIHNAEELSEVLDHLSNKGYQEAVEAERAAILAVYEDLFDHKSFTGRSGTFYGYEGLGSIYWHMVSKLLMAVQENILNAYHQGCSAEVLGNLIDHYYEIRAGIGVNKSPHLYGGFTTDAYSHTPGNAGVQQPGMTGQVKEDVINRWGEFGIVISNGVIKFEPILLRQLEFKATSSTFDYFDVNDQNKQMAIPENALAFTYCQTPIVYQMGANEQIQVHYRSGDTDVIDGSTMTRAASKSIFDRDGNIISITFTCVPLLVK